MSPHADSPTLGKLKGRLKLARGAGMSKCSIPRLQLVFGLMVLAVASPFIWLGVIYFGIDDRNEFQVIAALSGMLIALAAAAYSWLQYRGASTLTVFETGIRFDDPRHYVRGKAFIGFEEFDMHENRVMSLPANHMIRDSRSRYVFTFRLSSFPVTAKSHEMIVVTEPSDEPLANWLANQLQCSNDDWIGNVFEGRKGFASSTAGQQAERSRL